MLPLPVRIKFLQIHISDFLDATKKKELTYLILARICDIEMLLKELKQEELPIQFTIPGCPVEVMIEHNTEAKIFSLRWLEKDTEQYWLTKLTLLEFFYRISWITIE